MVGEAVSIPKELLKPLRRQCGIPRRILNIAMTEISLDCPGVVAVVGELIAGMAQHVGMSLDAQIGHSNCPLHKTEKAGSG